MSAPLAVELVAVEAAEEPTPAPTVELTSEETAPAVRTEEDAPSTASPRPPTSQSSLVRATLSAALLTALSFALQGLGEAHR